MTSGFRIRATLNAAAAASMQFDDCFIGHAAPSGDPYDFETTPVRLTFGGANGATIAAAGELVSDDVAFTLSAAKHLIASIHLNAVSSVSSVASSPGNHLAYYKAVSEAGQADVSAYGNSNTSHVFSKIEVLS